MAKADTVTIVDSGSLGGTVYWYIGSDRVLRIYGNGVASATFRFSSYNDLFDSVVIEDGVVGLGSYHFSSCTISDISFPDSLLDLGDFTFYRASIGDTISLPSGLEVIGSSCFYLSSITNIDIPDSLTTLGIRAFSGTSITSISLPSTLTKISYGCFADCSSLESVTVFASEPPAVNQSPTDLFEGCSTNLRIYVPAGSVSAYETANGWNEYAAWIVGGAVSGSGAGSAGGSTGGGVEDTDKHLYTLSIYPEAKDKYYLGSQVQFYADFTIDGVKYDIPLDWSTNEPNNHSIDSNGLLTIADDPTYANAIIFCRPAASSGYSLDFCGSLTATYEIYLTFMTEEEANKPTVSGESAVLDAIDVLSLDVQLVQNSVDLLLEGDEISAAVSGNLGDASDELSSAVDQLDDLQQSQMDILDNNYEEIEKSVDFSGFIPALEFIAVHVTNIFSGMGSFQIIFSFSLYLGLFFFLCSRVPGSTVPKVRSLSRSQGDNS